MSDIYLGTQGWNYAGWVGTFYPRGTRAADFLDQYVRIFDTVEIDSTFYAIPSEASICVWHGRAPANFTYSLKLTQEITHQRRLADSAEILAAFCERVRPLSAHLAIILIQLPPDFLWHSWRTVENFLQLLPRDLRFAIEFRDRSWLNTEHLESSLDLLRTHGVALALCDSKWLSREVVLNLVDRPTADFAYVRWLGPRELTDFSRIQLDRSCELTAWAEAFKILRTRVDQIYGYFNNHFQGHSPASCNQFKKMIGLSIVEPDVLVDQPSLF